MAVAAHSSFVPTSLPDVVLDDPERTLGCFNANLLGDLMRPTVPLEEAGVQVFDAFNDGACEEGFARSVGIGMWSTMLT